MTEQVPNLIELLVQVGDLVRVTGLTQETCPVRYYDNMENTIGTVSIVLSLYDMLDTVSGTGKVYKVATLDSGYTYSLQDLEWVSAGERENSQPD